MKISSIDVYQVDHPYANGVYRLSGGRTCESFDATIVKVSTDSGIVGWGESTPLGGTYVAAHAKGVRAGLDELAPAVLGMKPAHLDRINDALDTRSMVAKSTAQFDVPITNGGAEAPGVPGLGVEPDINVLGAPVASYKA